MVYNLPECKSSESSARISHDKNLLRELTQAIGFESSDELKMFKIGKPARNKLRPSKIIFGSVPEVNAFLDAFAKANLKVD